MRKKLLVLLMMLKKRKKKVTNFNRINSSPLKKEKKEKELKTIAIKVLLTRKTKLQVGVPVLLIDMSMHIPDAYCRDQHTDSLQILDQDCHSLQHSWYLNTKFQNEFYQTLVIYQNPDDNRLRKTKRGSKYLGLQLQPQQLPSLSFLH